MTLRMMRVTPIPQYITSCRFKRTFTAAFHGFFQATIDEFGEVEPIALLECSDGTILQLRTSHYDLEFTGATKEYEGTNLNYNITNLGVHNDSYHEPGKAQTSTTDF